MRHWFRERFPRLPVFARRFHGQTRDDSASTVGTGSRSGRGPIRYGRVAARKRIVQKNDIIDRYEAAYYGTCHRLTRRDHSFFLDKNEGDARSEYQGPIELMATSGNGGGSGSFDSVATRRERKRKKAVELGTRLSSRETMNFGLRRGVVKGRRRD